MKNKYFDIVVKKILKYKGKIIEIRTIKNIVQNILDTNYSDQRVYKMIYYLKNRGYLVSLKKDIFFVKNPDKEYSEQELLDNFYRNIVKKHCKEFLKSNWYVGGIKALELNNNNYDNIDNILIVNQYKQSTEVLALEKQICFKTYISEEKNLFKLFNKYTKKIYIGNNTLNVAGIELSLLEGLYNPTVVSEGYIYELTKKILRKYKKDLDSSVWEDILKNNKHHSSINRLYKLALAIDPQLSDEIKRIIKKYSYFIN